VTVKAQHTPQMPVEEFEELAAHVAERFDAVRLEFINGRAGIQGHDGRPRHRGAQAVRRLSPQYAG
jgi:hypothetical protein